MHSVLFADDTSLTLADDNYSKLVNTFNSELKNFYAWLIKIRLSLFLEKKNIYINFSLREYESDETLQLNGNFFSEVDRTKYLGFFFFDKKLSFSHHIGYTCNKLSKNIGILYRMSLSSPAYILKQVYHAIVAPYLNYCNLIWGGAASIHIDKLFKLQKRAIRVISNAGFLDHTQPLFIKENITNIYKLYEYMCCIHVSKNRDRYEIVNNIYNTRNTSSLQILFER